MKKFLFNKKFKLHFSKKYFFNNFNIKKSFYFNVLYKKNDINNPRLGIYISKKYIKLSSKRNILKRIIREKFRLILYKICNFDYLVKSSLNLNINFNKLLISKDLDYIFSIFY